MLQFWKAYFFFASRLSVRLCQEGMLRGDSKTPRGTRSFLPYCPGLFLFPVLVRVTLATPLHPRYSSWLQFAIFPTCGEAVLPPLSVPSSSRYCPLLRGVGPSPGVPQVQAQRSQCWLSSGPPQCCGAPCPTFCISIIPISLFVPSVLEMRSTSWNCHLRDTLFSFLHFHF